MTRPTIADLLAEYERALAHTEALWSDLTDDELRWRPHEQSSAIAWHLGHQPAVAHFMVRNLTSAEASIDPGLDALMDSATAEPDRGEVPGRAVLADYRAAVADRVRFNVGRIDRGDVGAPNQLRVVAHHLLVAIVNHEYQHDVWIAEVRRDALGRDDVDPPTSPWLESIDGYPTLVL